LIYPGETVIADVQILSKDYFDSKLQEGMLFDIFEGNHKVGDGSIITILNKKLLLL
jgi:hypothetical protein